MDNRDGNSKPNNETDDAKSALQSLLTLIDDGDLVRNTDGDHDIRFFMAQGLRIVVSVQKAQRVLGIDVAGLDGTPRLSRCEQSTTAETSNQK